MDRGVSRILATAAVAVAAFVAGAGVANAAPYTPTGVSLSSSTPKPGGTDTVSADGFQPGSDAKILIESTPVQLATATADANGVVRAQVTIPGSFAAGSKHTIEVTGTSNTGQPRTVSIGLTLAGGGSSLPFTGLNDVAAMAGAGIAVIAVGVFLWFIARRRRTMTPG